MSAGILGLNLALVVLVTEHCLVFTCSFTSVIDKLDLEPLPL